MPETRPSAGFSLVELLAAVALFAIVALAAYSAFDGGNKAYRRGEANAELQQRTRLAFDLIMDELRLAGFDHNRDGMENSYPDHPDEQLEYVAPHAVVFRGNLDYNDGNGGREPDLERDDSYEDYLERCCPIVTTGNDEIVAYALRSDDTTFNVDDLVIQVDTSAPRDAGWAEDGSIEDEEAIVIPNVDLTDAHPPYTLFRFTLDADGNLVEQAIADNVRTLTFTYEGEDGTDYYCTERAADGTCPTAAQVSFGTLGGDDDLSDPGDGEARAGRAEIRHLKLSLVGMNTEDDRRWVDADDTVMPHRRKLPLEGEVAPPNLGRRGRPDLDDTTIDPPLFVTLCTGQCNTARIEWDEVPKATSYVVNLYRQAETVPFFVAATPAIVVEGSSPRRMYAVYQRGDSPDLVEGATITARVQARSSSEETSELSDASDPATLTDVVRLEAPVAASATGYDPSQEGWPDLALNALLPVTDGTSAGTAAANAIVVSWEAPEHALDVLDAADPLNTWTTQVGGGAVAPLDCDSQAVDLDGDTTMDHERTWQREMTGDIRYFVFRSTDPRFVPTASHLIGSILGTVDVESGRVSYRDESVHRFNGDTFNATTNAIENCRTYYYRVRAVDDCYTGSDPAALDDAHLSPFAPPLNPDPSAQDSDDITELAPEQVGLAIPGFAVPRAVPRQPKEVRFTNYDRSLADGDGVDATIAFDAVKQDRLQVSPGDAFTPPTYDFDDIAIAEYQVFSHATNPDFTLSDAVLGLNGVRFEQSVLIRDLPAGRIARDDENGDGFMSSAEDESVPPEIPLGSPPSGLRVEADALGPRFYKVAAVQCEDEKTVPEEDDTAWDLGPLSEAVKFPCEFGGGPYSLIEVDATNFPDSAVAQAFVQDPLVPARRARLVLADPSTGDRVLSDPPGVNVGVDGVAFFSRPHIAALTDRFGSGEYRVYVEMEDSQECIGTSDVEDFTQSLPTCCLGQADPFVQVISSRRLRGDVSETCGTQDVRVHRITLEIDNTNKGQPERFEGIWWDSELLWTGSNRVVVIDRQANPLRVQPLSTHHFWMDFSRNPSGDMLWVTIEYRIAGAAGICTLRQEPVP